MHLAQTSSISHISLSTVQYGFTLKTCVNVLRHPLHEAVEGKSLLLEA